MLLSLLFAVALLAVPVTARAEGSGAPDKLVVAGTDVTAGGHWVTGADGTLSAGSASSYNVRYDGAGTLTLRGAHIGAGGILVEASADGTNAGDIALTIVLEGESSVEGNVWLGKDDGAQGNNQGYREASASTSLAITGAGSLDVTGSLLVHGVRQTSATGTTTLAVSGGARVLVADTSANSYPIVINGRRGISVTVDGATLSTRSASVGRGIYSYEPDAAPELIGKNGAIVRTGGLTSDGGPAFVTRFENSILLKGGTGEVFGSVTLPGDFSILPGETLTVDKADELTIPEGATLTVEQGATLVNHGTVNVEGAVVANQGTIICDSHSGSAGACGEQAACALCGTPYGEVLAHAWGEPTWSLSEDGEHLVATFTCERDASHVAVRKAVPAATVVTEPTCTEPGSVRYSATVELDGTSCAGALDAGVPALGHDFRDGVCVRCGVKAPSSTTEPTTATGDAIPAAGDAASAPVAALLALSAAALGLALVVARAK